MQRIHAPHRPTGRKIERLRSREAGGSEVAFDFGALDADAPAEAARQRCGVLLAYAAAAFATTVDPQRDDDTVAHDPAHVRERGDTLIAVREVMQETHAQDCVEAAVAK